MLHDGLVVWGVIVRVAGRDGEVVVGLVLEDRVIPAVADQHGGQVNLLGTRDVFGVLRLEVLAEDGAVVPAVALRREEELFARVLRERAHEPLQCLPEVGRRGGRRAGGRGVVRVRVGRAAPVRCVVGTFCARQLHDLVRGGVGVAGDGFGVGEADLDRLVDEDHVAGVGPRVRVVVDFSVGVHAAGTKLLPESDHGRGPGTAIDPDGQWSGRWVLISRLEEPEEDVLVLGDVCIAAEALDLGVKLADAGWHLLVADRDARVPSLVCEVARSRDKLRKGSLAGQRQNARRDD